MSKKKQDNIYFTKKMMYNSLVHNCFQLTDMMSNGTLYITLEKQNQCLKHKKKDDFSKKPISNQILYIRYI